MQRKVEKVSKSNLDHTMMFKALETEQPDVRAILEQVYKALDEKGYNPIDQLVGYLMTGDPAYITSFHDARAQIKKVDRDEVLEALLRNYLQK